MDHQINERREVSKGMLSSGTGSAKFPGSRAVTVVKSKTFKSGVKFIQLTLQIVKVDSCCLADTHWLWQRQLSTLRACQRIILADVLSDEVLQQTG